MTDTQLVTRRVRKKPVEVEAVQLTKENARVVAEWSRAQTIEKLDGSIHLLIPTLEGDHWANVGDWIIRGVKGEFYPVKPDIFPLTYELVEAAGSLRR